LSSSKSRSGQDNRARGERNKTVDIRVLIVDDEPFARERIRDFLKNTPEIADIDEAENGPQAIRKIQAQNPDLVFLDIQMPRMDGFAVLKAVGPEKMPEVVFVTAYDQYALQAFEVFALGYLLKPFDRDKFEKVLQRALDEIRLKRTGRDLARTMKEFLKEIQSGGPSMDRIFIKTKNRLLPVRIRDIDWIEASGKYIVLHAGAEGHAIRDSLSSMEKKLPPRQFRRTHRSSIVNIDSIKEIQPLFHGDSCLILKTGDKITLSRSYRDQFKDLFLD
jgi:two-component system LytT family response regulator